jgi:hypothetical protein
LGIARAALGYLFTDAPAAPAPPDEQLYWAIPNVLAGRPGPTYAPWNTQGLRDQGFGGIVSLDGPIRIRDIRLAGIEHLPVYQPMLLLHSVEDHLRFLSVMPRILAFVDRLRKASQATMVHCYYGCDRTGAVLASYLVAREGLDAESAIHFIQRVNPDALWAVGYADAVYTFEESFRARPELYQASPPS